MIEFQCASDFLQCAADFSVRTRLLSVRIHSRQCASDPFQCTSDRSSRLQRRGLAPDLHKIYAFYTIYVAFLSMLIGGIRLWGASLFKGAPSLEPRPHSNATF